MRIRALINESLIGNFETAFVKKVGTDMRVLKHKSSTGDSRRHSCSNLVASSVYFLPEKAVLVRKFLRRKAALAYPI